MELSEIVYSILAIFFFLIMVIFIISYLGYKMKQREGEVQSAPILQHYQDLGYSNSNSYENKWQ